MVRNTILLCLAALSQSCGVAWLFSPPDLTPVAESSERMHELVIQAREAHDSTASNFETVLDALSNLDPSAKVAALRVIAQNRAVAEDAVTKSADVRAANVAFVEKVSNVDYRALWAQVRARLDEVRGR